MVRVEAVKAIITEAFVGVSLGSGMGLHEAAAIDVCAGDDERKRERETDRERYANIPWHEVSHADLSWSACALPYLDAAGLRYFLPAVILWSLRHREDEFQYNFTHESLIYTLKDARPSIFSTRERGAITAFLSYEADHEKQNGETDAQIALDCWQAACRTVQGEE